jgi:hypothetical protein
MDQAVSRRPLTVEAQVRVRVSPCRICGGQSGTGTGFFRVLLFCSVSIIIPPGLHTNLSSGGRTISPLVVAVQRHSLTTSNKKYKMVWTGLIWLRIGTIGGFLT